MSDRIKLKVKTEQAKLYISIKLLMNILGE